MLNRVVQWKCLVANKNQHVAFRWVNSFMMDGKTAFEIYKDIVDGEIVIVE